MPVGRLLEQDAGEFEFTYIRAVREARERGFRPFIAFPDLQVAYRSTELPALFRNRVMHATRPDFPAFVSQLGLSRDSGPLQLLSRSGGRRATDKLEVFASPHESAGGTPEMFALVRGVRYVPHAEEAIAALQEGQRLLVLRDDQNPHSSYARLLRTADVRLIGYLPDYLARELIHRQTAEVDAPQVFVEKVNLSPAPVHHRVLCRIELPQGISLFQGNGYSPLAPDATSLAA